MSLEGEQIHCYRILRLLGSGGMGDVYLAEDARIEQQVAMSPATVAAQRASVTVSRPQDTFQPAQRGISRRTVLLRLAELTIVGMAGSSLVLLACSEPPATPAALTSPSVRDDSLHLPWAF